MTQPEKTFPTFQSLQELGGCLEAIYQFHYAHYQDSTVHPAFVQTLLGPTRDKLFEFQRSPIGPATYREAQAKQIADRTEEATGISKPFAFAHGRMRQQGGKIGVAFMPHFGDCKLGMGYDSHHSASIKARLGDEPLTVTANGQQFTFNHGGELAARAYDMAAMAETLSRNPGDSQAMKERLGLRNQTFGHLTALVDALEANLAPDSPSFEKTGWPLDMKEINDVFAEQKEFFHNSRILFYTMYSANNQVDNQKIPQALANLLFWKSPLPVQGAPLVMESPMDVACGWYGMTWVMSQCQPDMKRLYHRQPNMELAGVSEIKETLHRQSQEISEQPTMEKVRELLATDEYRNALKLVKFWVEYSVQNTVQPRFHDLLDGLEQVRDKGIVAHVHESGQPPIEQQLG